MHQWLRILMLRMPTSLGPSVLALGVLKQCFQLALTAVNLLTFTLSVARSSITYKL